MAKYPRMDDLLRNQRRRSRRRGRGRGRFLLIVLLLGGAGAGWWYVSKPDPELERQASRGELLAEATAAVGRSLRAAQAPITVKESVAESEANRREAELEAVWSEGEATRMRGELEQNQSIAGVLQARNISSQAIHAVVMATNEEFDFRRSRPGDKWFTEVDEDGHITRFRYQTSPEDIWETTRSGEGEYQTSKIEVPVQIKREVISGVVQSSLWQSMADQGEDGSLIYNFTDMFAYTIDFNANTHPGDRFALIFEKIYSDNTFLRYGKVLAGTYISGERVNYGFFHQTDDEESGYYDERGENLKRQFLKSPLASVRITSAYGKRFHPILNQAKLHNGIDYGAPIGTKVRAVADGTVRFAGMKGANGNLVVLEHANGYRTMYAHLSKISKGIRPGKRVSKRTIIALTGNTGRSTGPHLHFGMTRHGKYVDPRSVDSERGEPLEKAEKEEFIEEVAGPMKKRLDRALKASGFQPPDPPREEPKITSR